MSDTPGPEGEEDLLPLFIRGRLYAESAAKTTPPPPTPTEIANST